MLSAGGFTGYSSNWIDGMHLTGLRFLLVADMAPVFLANNLAMPVSLLNGSVQSCMRLLV